MATDILEPQNCLVQRIRHSPADFHRRRIYEPKIKAVNSIQTHNYKSIIRSNRRAAASFDYRKRTSGSTQPNGPNQSSIAKRCESKTARSDVLVTVTTILRRGDSDIENVESPTICDIYFKSPVTGKCDVYAGSAFCVSPAPGSVPLPSFSGKTNKLVDDSATRDIRRLLRLDL